MTTTVVNMEATIKLLREKCPDCKIMVGGAVLTQEYADMIGADFMEKTPCNQCIMQRACLINRI